MKAIDKMLSRPGLYVLSTRLTLTFVEVDERGACYQLSPFPGYPRDGKLSRDGWNEERILRIDGPFLRASEGAGLSEAQLDALDAWKARGEALMAASSTPMMSIATWWAERPWRKS